LITTFIDIIRLAMSENQLTEIQQPLKAGSERRLRLQADLTLLLVSIIWGSAFVAQRVAAAKIGVFWFNGLRFLLGALVLLPFAWRDLYPVITGRRKEIAGILAAGFFLWAGAAFQQAGLIYTTAGNAGFITGLYVVLIPIFLALRGTQRPPLLTWVASFLAAVGLFLLSTGGKMQLNPGDSLELLGAVFWALHVILVGWLVQRMPILALAVGQYLACAAFSLGAGLLFERNTLPALAQGWWAIAYTGLLSVGLGYTLQAKGQRLAPPVDAAIILSTEAVFAALSGWIILAERLTVTQLAGCGVMLAGMLLAQSGSILNGWKKGDG
jgi:drug/metabolite transporter (DMT)-like permease